MKAVLASYTLSLAVFIPISGWMANRFGTRRVFASAIGIFTLGSFLCGISTDIHLLVACRILAGLRRRDDAAGGAAHHGAHLCQIRIDPRHELRRHSRPDRSDARAADGRIDHRVFSLERHFLREHPDRPRRIGSWCTGICRITAPQENYPLDIIGLVLFGSGISLLVLCARGVRRAHVERARDRRGCSRYPLRCSPPMACTRVRTSHPLLRLSLVRIRSFRVSVTGNLLTRLGIGGIPFLLPLLYQVGLGFTPIQSGLMIMPQALAAISFKFTLPRILQKIRLPAGIDRQHRHVGRHADAVLDDRRRHARLADRRCSPSFTAFSHRRSTPA